MSGQNNRVIMGIDPGTNRMGYGVLKVCGRNTSAEILGDIDLHRMSDPYAKLQYIFRRVSELIKQYDPDEVALESPFFGQNVQSMLKLGRAQGVAMAAALSLDKQVFEYAPRRIKQAITGQGSASKIQVAALLKSMLGIEFDPKRLDATDGLAVALCHFFTTTVKVEQPAPKSLRRHASCSSWETFIKENPDRIRKMKNAK